MNSNMVQPEKFSHLHLVYYFTIPLTQPTFNSILRAWQQKVNLYIFFRVFNLGIKAK